MKNSHIAHMRTLITYISLSLIICTSLSGCASAQASAPVTRSAIFFDTAVSVTLYEYPGNSAPILDGCMGLCTRYDALLSATTPGSDIWNINHASPSADGSKSCEISGECADVLRIALDYADTTNGVITPTAGILADLWDIKGNSASEDPHPPADVDITEALKHIDHAGISVTPSSDDKYIVTCTDPDADLTLGCIAKGYVADRLRDYLIDAGVTSALIDLGGNISAIGSKPDGANFRIGIQAPFKDRGETICTVSISDMSVVSSGTYERYFTAGGHLYHHIFDTKNGYPADTGVCGVTVISSSSAQADALSTLCLILGPGEGLAAIESTADTEAMFITSDDQMITSSGWDRFMP